MGRPTKYKSEYCAELVRFFSVEPSRREVVAEVKGYGKAGNQNFVKTEYKLVPNQLPTFAAFARKIGVSKDTIVSEWVKKHPEFSDAYNEAKELQKEFLVTNGLSGLYPPASFIFTAKNITDMTDRQELTGKDGQPLMPVADVATKTADELLKLLTAKSADSARRRPGPGKAGRSH